MKRKPFQAWICYLIVGIYLLFTGSLMFMSLFMHCQTNIYDYEHGKTIERHMPFLYCALVALAVGMAAAGCMFVRIILWEKEKIKRMGKFVFWCCGAVILGMSLFWIVFNDSMPVNDQRDVFLEAQRIAGFLEEPFDTAYFSYFPRNRGITLLTAAVIKIFGNRLWTARLINLPAVLLLYFCVCRAAELIWKNPIITSFTSILMMLFYPTVIYTSYLYGTLLSAALCAGGIYAALLLSEKGGRRYELLFLLAFTAGILAHQSAAVGLLAALVYLLLGSGRREWKRNLFLAVMSAAMVYISLNMVDLVYNRITGADPDASAVPASCTIYMGITSSEGAAGPGSQDRSYTDIFNENNCDGRAANKDAICRIGKALQEYAVGERDVSFFRQKMQYQWLDPTFGARKTIVLNDPNAGDAPNSETFVSFYDSPLRAVIFKLTIGFMLLVYFGAVVGGVGGIRKTHREGRCQAQTVIWIYVIGGGAFQMIWESFSRYCFGYFIWLIPMAAYGIYLCCHPGYFLKPEESVYDY